MLIFQNLTFVDRANLSAHCPIYTKYHQKYMPVVMQIDRKREPFLLAACLRFRGLKVSVHI